MKVSLFLWDTDHGVVVVVVVVVVAAATRIIIIIIILRMCANIVCLLFN